MASKEQKEGIARVFDTITASAMIGMVIGLSGHSDMTIREILSLAGLCPVLLISSWILRSPSK